MSCSGVFPLSCCSLQLRGHTFHCQGTAPPRALAALDPSGFAPPPIRPGPWPSLFAKDGGTTGARLEKLVLLD